MSDSHVLLFWFHIFKNSQLHNLHVTKQISCDFVCQVEKHLRDSHVKMNIFCTLIL